MRIWKEFAFSAGHYLTGLPQEHKCSTQHGHTYRFRLYISGSIDRTVGWIADWGGLVRGAAEMILHEVDHKNLNTVAGLEQPTAENLATWIWRRVAATQLAPLTEDEKEWCRRHPLDQVRPHLVAVKLYEDLTTGVWYEGE